jgi:DNA-binding CsgD family transcriptional regulator
MPDGTRGVLPGHGQEPRRPPMPVGGGPVAVRVRSSVLRHAIGGLLAGTGWWMDDQSAADSSAPTVAEPSLWASRRAQTILLLPRSTPVACSVAVQRIVRNEAVGVVSSEAIGELVDALEALGTGKIYLTAATLEHSSLVQPLTRRQVAVLRALVAGQEVEGVASSACLSVSTVKRTVSELLAVHGVRSRLLLVRTAVALGYEGRVVTGPLP